MLSLIYIVIYCIDIYCFELFHIFWLFFFVQLDFSNNGDFDMDNFLEGDRAVQPKRFVYPVKNQL